MKLKNTAFAYNVTVQGSSNCDWGTDIGQGKKHTFTLEGFPELLNAMVYYKIEDIDQLKVKLGKGTREPKPFADYKDQLVLASCFKKVYVNETLLEGQQFIMFILKEVAELNSKGEKNVHNGRCTLKFSNSLLYKDIPVNQNCIDAISDALGVSKEGSWVILEMQIENEDELHLYGFPIDNKAKDFNTTDERNKVFNMLMDKEYRRKGFKEYLYHPDTFKHQTTSRLYWQHVSDPFYKKRLQFVWNHLSTIIDYKSDDLFDIDNVEYARKLRTLVLADPGNVYGAQLASAIITNYIRFLEKGESKVVQLNKKTEPQIPLLDEPIQQIFYGAPGTGKSNGIKKFFKDKNINEKEFVFRTTFHPDSDYSTFVGAYKPMMKEEKIIYTFAPQAFTYAYIKAYNSEQPVFLVIEEINRGNCAQIFGDLFQLLDRDENGASEYPIKASEDLCDYLLYAKDKNGNDILINKDGIANGELILPPNLYIWATMNTSDQSLFPIDSAFKRRWDWVYTPIKDAGEGWKIQVEKSQYDWWEFLKAINEQIASTTSSEDKKMGYFFCKACNEGKINADKFVNKVIFYLWNDVFKDYELPDAFKKADGHGHMSFNDFYTKQDECIHQLMKNLKVQPDGQAEETEAIEEPTEEIEA